MASTPPSSRAMTKKSIAVALVAGVLVVGAIFGGVFGGRAVAKKKRVPIPVEAVTYSMVAEGFSKGAVVTPVKIPSVAAASSPSNETTAAATTTTADKAPAGIPVGGSQGNPFTWDYWFGVGGIGAVPMFDPLPVVLPPNAVTVPTWATAVSSGAFQPNADGRVMCYANTGQDVMDMVSGDESPCEVVILTQDRFTPYSISKTLNITKPKLLIGRPIFPPMLNSTNRIVRLIDGKTVSLAFWLPSSCPDTRIGKPNQSPHLPSHTHPESVSVPSPPWWASGDPQRHHGARLR